MSASPYCRATPQCQRCTCQVGCSECQVATCDVYMNADSIEDFDRAGRIYAEGLSKYPDSALM